MRHGEQIAAYNRAISERFGFPVDPSANHPTEIVVPGAQMVRVFFSEEHGSLTVRAPLTASNRGFPVGRYWPCSP